jgi:HPr kinase/phosphorylase
MSEVNVGTLLKEKSERLKLQLISGVEGLARPIKVSEINRPGLVFSGFFEHFPAERVQIIGLAEHAFLRSLSEDRQREVLEKMLSYPDFPCSIITRNLEPLNVLKEVHERMKAPLILSDMKPSQLMAEIIFYLEDKMAKKTKVHGVLVSVYGLGVLIIGNAGIGKSESALELVKRGHMFVADDVVELRQRSGGTLIGKGEEIIQHHMEVRGLGIVNVHNLFGIGFILNETKIDLVVRLVDWSETQDYERVGLEDHFTTFLEVQVPEIVLPVRPGRNLAILIEMASLNQRLKNEGRHSAKELNQRLLQIMSKG